MLTILLLGGLLGSLLGGCASVASEAAASPAAKAGVDLDMTNMGAAIAYSQAVDLSENPDNYLGKVIKVKGNYYPTYYDQTAQYYHLVLVGDATSCCRMPIEFIVTGDYTFPDDYPETEAVIIVSGVYEEYDELGETYYHLVAEDITFATPALDTNLGLAVQ
jgi:hypothetical protein